jgi:hypothetical protein
MAVEWCKPCKDRGKLSMAQRIVEGTPMCDECFTGKPSNGVSTELAAEVFEGRKKREGKGMAKHLDEAKQEAIRKDGAAGMPLVAIAAKHGVSWPTAKQYAGDAKKTRGGQSQKFCGRSARASSEISRRSEWRRDADGDAGIVRLDLGHAAAGEKSGAAESAR